MAGLLDLVIVCCRWVVRVGGGDSRVERKQSSRGSVASLVAVVFDVAKGINN
jgi:hypothetical protein